MTDDYSYFRNKLADKTYASRRLRENIRIASKVFDTPQEYKFAAEREEIVIRELPGTRHEIVAKFLEFDRRVFVLNFQKWRTQNGTPLDRVNFSFFGAEVPRLIEFLENVKRLHFPDERGINIRDDHLKVVAISDADARRIITENWDIVRQIASSDVSMEEIVALAYRKGQLAVFEKLLSDGDYFSGECAKRSVSPEDLWQGFFSKQISGYLATAFPTFSPAVWIIGN